MPAYAKREISPEFVRDLLSGSLQIVLAAVTADDTLSLNIRASCICIYYRGGCLIKINNTGTHRYTFEFDQSYTRTRWATKPGFPRPYCGPFPAGDDGDGWVALFPVLKYTMDLWFGDGHEKREREYQQLVERTNNGNPATDYFVCDVEYTNPLCRELRADLVALHWPSTWEARRHVDRARLAIIEMKFADAALGGHAQTAGIVDHMRKLAAAVQANNVSFHDLAEEMLGVFNTRIQLGLIRCHSDKGKIAKTLTRINTARPEFILLLADQDPEKTPLLREIHALEILLANLPDPPFDVKVASASCMGYGLYDQFIDPLPVFIQERGRRLQGVSSA